MITEPAPTSHQDTLERLTSYAAMARWAPSKHNSQPWCFQIHDGALELSSDLGRALPVTDPDGRERVISLGAAVHVASVAIRSRGYQPHLELLPAGADWQCVRLSEGSPSPASEDDRALCAAVPRRRTDRGPLDATSLPPSLRFLLQSAAGEYGATLQLVTSEGDRRTLSGLIERADRLLVRQSGVDEELTSWLREDGDPSLDGVPATHTRGPAASYRAPFVQRDFSTPASRPAQDRPGRDDPIIGILCTTGDRRTDWLAAGQALSAVLLRAAAAGAHASYLNQPLEVVALRAELERSLALPGPAQLVLRLGVGGQISPPPRRDLQLLLDLSEAVSPAAPR